MQSGYNNQDLVQEAQTRWLKPAEVLFILQNHEDHQLTHQPPQKPLSGSLFLYNKRVLRFFRKDGHSWRRKKDGRTVGEAHERLKVGNVEALNCYYAHGEQNPSFQRRSYWMLDPVYEHIVLVHYRDISEGKHNGGSVSRLSQASPSPFSQIPTSYTAQLPGSTAIMSERCDPCQSLSSPASVEVSSDAVIGSNGVSQIGITERTGEVDGSSDIEVSQALRRLEEQLSLNDDNLNEVGPLYDESENSNNSEYTTTNESFSRLASMQSPNGLLQELHSGKEADRNYYYLSSVGSNEEHHLQMLGNGYTVGSRSSITWKQMLDSCENSPVDESQEKQDMIPPPSSSELNDDHQNLHLIDFEGTNSQKASWLLPQEVENFKFPSYSPSIYVHGPSPDCYMTLFDHDQFEMPLEGGSSLTIVGKQKFTIREISPEWGYASEATKVFIIGSFLCAPSDCPWTCMFGDIEVPLQIFQEGVIRCQAPPLLPGKVTLCITSGNRESCSEVREFEYRVKPGISANNSLSEPEVNRSPDELLLLVRFVQMLLSDLSMQKGESSETGINLLGKSKAGEDFWSQVIESLLVGSWTPSSTMDWLLQELLKDKLQQWLSSRSQEGSEQAGSFLSKKEQRMIHMIAGLGFQWALNPFLNSGVNVNFRDINGWTALHWAARFGREKIVASLLASGALAGAVTDPNSQDPVGKTAASIAASYGHKGLAGYLSEVALTSHLSSLTLEESELSKGSANVEAEKTVNSLSMTTVTANEDQLSLKDTLAAVRNAAQAAARIQSAFRAHSFRKRQQKEAAAAAAASGDKYSILSNDIQGLSAASKLAFLSMRDYNAAALSIQKKYRGWKGRKDFLTFRQKVVKIQAHVRGHQVRKNYKVCWATSILEKVILRWRRKGVGLRGFHNELEIDESEDEDILKVFRKQKVDAAIDEAVARVLSMVESQEARQQYRRMLEKYRQAKAELQNRESEAALTSQGDIFSTETEDLYLFT